MTGIIKKPKDQKKEAGFILIAAIIIMTLLGFLGVTASYLFTSGTTTTKDYLLSTRAFFIAEGGVEYVGKYLRDQGSPNWSTITPPSGSISLGDGSFSVVFTNQAVNNLDAVVTGVVPGSPVNAQRQVTATFQKDLAVRSRGGISMGNNAYVDCDPTNPSNPLCYSSSCACTNTNVSAANMPIIPVPSPTPPAPSIGCSYPHHSTGTITPGVYYCSSMTFDNSAVVSLSGPVTIYTQSLTIDNGATFNNSGNPRDLLIIVQGTVPSSLVALIDNNAILKGAIYAPGYDIRLDNNAEVWGTLSGGASGDASTIRLNNNAKVYYRPTQVTLTNWVE
ncbi:MAG: hypothetical protein HY879_14140 [Deltaproteobacteria bacterium]|nr:hypothetical protein [Deltaproteobacteria bacterium]